LNAIVEFEIVAGAYSAAPPMSAAAAFPEIVLLMISTYVPAETFSPAE
jgi:hypothetical protein